MDQKAWQAKICDRVREVRRQSGLSQMNFANRADLSYHTIGKIERREVFPNLETLIRLSEAHRVPLADFFQETAKVSARRERILRDLTGLLRGQEESRLELAAGLIRYLMSNL